MQVSARILGQEYGLTSQEMNYALKKLGFLAGEPGSYTPTEKALKYIEEKDFHRGTGGYPTYNRYWTTRTYDDSIKNVLSINGAFKDEVRSELAEIRAKKRAELFVEQVQRTAELKAKEVNASSAIHEGGFSFNSDTMKTIGEISLFLIGMAGIAYASYKLTPKIKKWWRDRKEGINGESIIQ